jgi:ubiquinone/menaquinone biosynthesis C-methylase UbiE
MASNDTVFAGSIPTLYDRHLGPMLFRPYAEEVASRVADLRSGLLLETAAGTGIVTSVLAERLSPDVDLVATDLNQAMLDFAAAKPGMARVKFRQADALALPFDTSSVDVVLCQFGAMFFPDRVAGYREARRVLKPGGRLVFSIWDSLAHNPVTRCVQEALDRHFPADPPRFLARTPHGHYDQKVIRAELAAAGFGDVAIETVTLPSRTTHRDPAVGFCQGSPVRNEIEARAPQELEAATEAVAAAVAAEFGTGPIEAPMQALMIVAVK